MNYTLKQDTLCLDYLNKPNEDLNFSCTELGTSFRITESKEITNASRSMCSSGWFRVSGIKVL